MSGSVYVCACALKLFHWNPQFSGPHLFVMLVCPSALQRTNTQQGMLELKQKSFAPTLMPTLLPHCQGPASYSSPFANKVETTLPTTSETSPEMLQLPSMNLNLSHKVGHGPSLSERTKNTNAIVPFRKSYSSSATVRSGTPHSQILERAQVPNMHMQPHHLTCSQRVCATRVDSSSRCVYLMLIHIKIQKLFRERFTLTNLKRNRFYLLNKHRDQTRSCTPKAKHQHTASFLARMVCCVHIHITSHIHTCRKSRGKNTFGAKEWHLRRGSTKRRKITRLYVVMVQY